MVVIARPSSLGRKGQAGEHALAIDMHRAGAALALVAAFLGAGQVQVVAQGIEQRDARLDLQFMVGVR